MGTTRATPWIDSRRATVASSKASEVATGTFKPVPDNCVLSDDRSRMLEAGDADVGWLAKAGRVPLGYLGDAAKTQRTFPELGGVRYSLPGDRARVGADGAIELLGRDSVTINSGGEKVFPEEVEGALKSHPDVFDVLVVGLPDDRWGEKVTALLQPRPGRTPTLEDLQSHCQSHIAGYKVPRALHLVEEVPRLPNGKPDYRTAQSRARDLAGLH